MSRNNIYALCVSCACSAPNVLQKQPLSVLSLGLMPHEFVTEILTNTTNHIKVFIIEQQYVKMQYLISIATQSQTIESICCDFCEFNGEDTTQWKCANKNCENVELKITSW